MRILFRLILTVVKLTFLLETKFGFFIMNFLDINFKIGMVLILDIRKYTSFRLRLFGQEQIRHAITIEINIRV